MYSFIKRFYPKRPTQQVRYTCSQCVCVCVSSSVVVCVLSLSLVAGECVCGCVCAYVCVGAVGVCGGSAEAGLSFVSPSIRASDRLSIHPFVRLLAWVIEEARDIFMSALSRAALCPLNGAL